MTDQDDKQQNNPFEAPVTQERRDFLRGLGKWSQAVIGGVLLGGAVRALGCVLGAAHPFVIVLRGGLGHSAFLRSRLDA